LRDVSHCALYLSQWQYSFKPQSLPKTSYKPDNLPFHRIRTGPSVHGLEHLDLSLCLFCRSNHRKKRCPQLSRPHVLSNCGNGVDILWDYCCYCHTWRGEVVAFKRSTVSFSSSLN
jgi:hypothetical protein